MVIVPSTMEILGKANWWLPKWLDPLIPHIGFESVQDADLEAELAAITPEPASAEGNGRRKRPLVAPGRERK
jgi:RND superfamily putative drug exporter